MPISLTRRGWCFALAALALWASCFVIGLRDMFYLVALLAALVALSLLVALALPLAARFDLSVRANNPTPTVGDRVSLIATVKHHLPVTLSARLVWVFEEDRHTAPLLLRPGITATSQLSCIAEARGKHTAQITAILVTDPLGLANRRIRLRHAHPATVEVLVLPRLLDELLRRFDELALGAALAPDTATTHARAAEVADTGAPGGAVREHRSGDPLREIHWKQSARQGELLVNLHERDEPEQRSLQLVTVADAYASEGQFEAAVSAAATVLTQWLREGHTARLLLSDDSILCHTEAEMLRALALTDLAATPSAEPPTTATAGVIVSGALTQRLRQELRRARGGALILVADEAATDAPAAWQQIVIAPARYDAPEWPRVADGGGRD